jgi:cytochrome c biogenesis protein CcmG, thiol:disulfide interchange protein DsbE
LLHNAGKLSTIEYLSQVDFNFSELKLLMPSNFFIPARNLDFTDKTNNMKKSVLIAAAFLFSLNVFSQTSANNKLRANAGKQILASTFDNEDKPYIICFWSPSKPGSHEFLDAMNSLYKSWQKETGVKVIAVAVGKDNSLPLIQSHGWNFEHYIDEDQGYMQLMNVTDIPHIFVFNGKKQIVLQMQSYQPGDELIIKQALKANP